MKELYFENPSIITAINNNDPIYDIKQEEFDFDLLLFGSFVSIIKNKKINQTNILLLMIENPDFLNIFKKITAIDNEPILLYNFILKYPILYKSKIIKSKIEKIVNDKPRKAVL